MIIGAYVLITLVLSGLYTFLLIYVLEWWAKIPNFQASTNIFQKLSLSIIIPARNEANNIAACLDSILASFNTSDHEVEIIVIDDHSTDKTTALVNSYPKTQIQLLHLKDFLAIPQINAYKKAALAYGLSIAKGDYIVQLDADVVVTKNYINEIGSAINFLEPDFMAAPVIFTPNQNILTQFQCLDMLGMMLLTAAGIESKNWYMANGANMIYKKQLAPNNDDSGLASGDDIYTIQNIAKQTTLQIKFLKSNKAEVLTKAESTYTAFWRQRLRWATKNKSMTNPKMLLMMAIPFVNAVWLFAQLIALFWGGAIVVVVAGFHVLSLMAIDYIYLQTASNYFNKSDSMRYFLPSFFFHKMYLGIIGIASLFVTNYKWKERVVK